jgi:hypothetical protein
MGSVPNRRRSYQCQAPILALRGKDSGHNNDEPLMEGMLLLSHASLGRRARVVGRRVAGKSAPKDDSSEESQTHDSGI